MKYLALLLISTYLCSEIYAQNICMDLGGANHQGVYNTKPLLEFTKLKWKTQLNGIAKANLIMKDSVIYTSSMTGTYKDATRKGFAYAINCNSGEKIWQRNFDNSVSAPILKDTMLYYGSDEKNTQMRALSNTEGNAIWEFPISIASCWPPAVYNDKAFFGDHQGNWFVLNNTNGEQLFTQNIQAGICCVPSVVNNVVYYCDLNGGFHAFNPTTYADSLIFLLEKGSNNSPVIVDGVAYIMNKGGILYAIDINKKKELWRFKSDDSMFRSPAVFNGVATFITTNGKIFALNSNTGEPLWWHIKPGLGYTNTTIVNDVVYVGCADNCLYAFDLKTGAELWKFKADYPVNTPLVDDGTVYFTSGNFLYAIQ